MINVELFRQVLIKDVQNTISTIRINSKVITIDITNCNENGTYSINFLGTITKYERY